jgi:hypothetical protein
MTGDFSLSVILSLFGTAFWLQFTTHWYLDYQMGRKFQIFGRKASWILPYTLPVDERLKIVKRTCNISFFIGVCLFIAAVVILLKTNSFGASQKLPFEKNAFIDTTIHISDSEKAQLIDSFKKEIKLIKR